MDNGVLIGAGVSAGAGATALGVSAINSKARGERYAALADITTGPANEFRLMHDPVRTAEVDEVSKLLRDAEIVEASKRPFPDAGDNPARIIDVVAPGRKDGVLTAVIKMPDDYAAPEVFQTKIANKLGIGGYYGQAEIRPDGRALLEIVPGKSLKKAGVHTPEDMLRVIETNYAKTLPQMPAAERAMRAKVDLELVQFVDWFTAQADRSPNNGNADALEGILRIRDNGKMTQGETPFRATRPWNPYGYMGTGGRTRTIQLSPEARSIIRNNLSPDDIRDAAKVFHLSNEGEPFFLKPIRAYQRSEGFIERLLTRRNAAVVTGELTSINKGLRTAALELFSNAYPMLAKLRP